MNSESGGSSATSNHVYVHSEEHKWIPATLLRTDGETATVRITGDKAEEKIKLADYPNKVLPLQNVDEDGKLNEVEDMVDLPFLHEVRTEDLQEKKATLFLWKYLTKFLFFLNLLGGHPLQS